MMVEDSQWFSHYSEECALPLNLQDKEIPFPSEEVTRASNNLLHTVFLLPPLPVSLFKELARTTPPSLPAFSLVTQG